MAGGSLLLLSSTHTLLASPDPPLTLAISPDKCPFSLRVSASAPLERLGSPRVYRGSFARTRSGAPRRGREPGRAPVPSLPFPPGPVEPQRPRALCLAALQAPRAAEPAPSIGLCLFSPIPALPPVRRKFRALLKLFSTDSLPTSANFARRAGSGCALSPPRAPRAAQRLARALRGRGGRGPGLPSPERGLPPSPPNLLRRRTRLRIAPVSQSAIL